MTKITLIGAGSASFGLSTLLDLVAYGDELAGAQVILTDVDPAGLDLMVKMGRLLDKHAGTGLQIEGTTNLDASLVGADFVIVSVARDRAATWKRDWDIPRNYGIKHVLGENGGPGGLGHTLRSVHLMVDVARHIESVAPDAWVLNFTNPMTRICLGLARATPKLKVVGLCHGIGSAYRSAGIVMGIVKDASEVRGKMEMLQQRYDIKAAGLNHFTFVYHMYDNERGEDIYPEFRERAKSMPADFEPLSRRMMDAFDLWPAIGDGHIGEYVSYAWETSAMKGYDFDGYTQKAAEVKQKLRQAVAGEIPIDDYVGHKSGERAIPIISAIRHNLNRYEDALNLPNHGSIPGLPEWAIVELPSMVSASGVVGLTVPELPPGVTAMLAQQIAVQDRAVHAALTGDRQAALQALLLDPVVPSYEAAVNILDDLLTAHAPYLPLFAEAVPA